MRNGSTSTDRSAVRRKAAWPYQRMRIGGSVQSVRSRVGRVIAEPIVDVHAHFVPEELLTAERGFRFERDETWGRVLWHGERALGPVPDRLTRVDAVLADMDERRIDIRALATTSWLTFYWAEPGLGLELARAANELVAGSVRGHEERL